MRVGVRGAVPVAALLGALSACGAEARPPEETVAASFAVPRWQDTDWRIFETKVRWALEERVDTLPMGAAVAAIGRTFVGTPYTPHTLEAPGPEALVVNFRELDCVTFVETVFALARFVKASGAGALVADRAAAEARYGDLLEEIRYRGGRLDGYPSRLHYFSDWILDGVAKGLVVDVTRELGGVPVTDVIDFMSTHPEAYRQLGEDPAHLEAIRATEARLSAQERWYVPEGGLSVAAPGIRDGDIIAATSTVDGLDVAHTGLALWVDGRLHLMHAPLVGDSVEISTEDLPARIRRISGQDGVIVARAREGAR